MFDEWLSPDVMTLLVASYANTAPDGSSLKWKYMTLRPRVWGEFSAHNRTLYVNQSKTKNLFAQQVKTILHEIQHWNQFVDFLKDGKDLTNWTNAYRVENRVNGYWKNRYEVDARDFSTNHLEEAMARLGRHYGQKVEGGSFELALDELLDEFSDEDFVTRAQIGQALKDHGVNTPENMKNAISTLTDLELKVR